MGLETSFYSHVLIVASCIGVITVILQTFLLLSLANPSLGQTRAKMKRSRYSKKNKSDTDIMHLIKRLISCAAACVVATTVAAVVVHIISKNILEVFWPNIASSALIISNISIMFSFANWRQKLFPVLY